MEGKITESSIPWDDGGLSNNKKKKGRRKSCQDETYYCLPEHAIIEKSEQSIAELHAAYRIFQSIMAIKHISPFVDKPQPDKFGMSSYFSVIKKPMWLNEVRRKIESGEYEGLHDFVEDLHLILYNCYKFWGHTHRISFRGYIIEHKIETKLSELSWSLRANMKCTVSTGGCIICDSSINNSDIDNEAYGEDNIDDPNIVRYNSKGYESKIVVKVLEEDEDEQELDEESEESKNERLIMEKWEEETLNKLEGASDLKHIAELVDIGLFLKLTHEVLNVEEMTQYEVERMLLIPMESASLQTIMTSALSPEWKRTTLDETPLMPYAVWNSKLRQKINSWFQVFYRYCDTAETFTHTGIDPYFWSVSSLLNPMDDGVHFHELSFYVRIWIFKSLLDNLLHTNKSLQDVLLDEKTDTNSLRHLYLGKGAKNNHYRAVPHFLPEIRVYKETKPLISTWQKCTTDCEASSVNLQGNRMTFDGDTMSWGPNKKTFEIAAYDIAGIDALIEFAEEKLLNELAQSLIEFKSTTVSHIHCEGLKSVYRQYHDFRSRPCEYFTNMDNLWLSYTAKPVKEEKNVESQDSVLGKRRITPNKLIYSGGHGLSDSSMETEDEQDESDVSDWESSYKNHQRKKKLKSSKISEKSSELRSNVPLTKTSIGDTALLSKDAPTLSTISIKEEPLLTEFKMEVIEVTKPVIAEDSVSSTTNEFPDSEPGFGITIAATSSIREVKEEDTVVVLSSEDEEDVKPSINKIKLRDVNTLLESPPLSSVNSVQPIIQAPSRNTPPPMPPSIPPSLSGNSLNVVIPMNVMNQMSPQVPPRPTMSLQVPPNLFQMSQPRPRLPMTRQIMPVRQPVRQNMRQPIRQIVPRNFAPNNVQRVRAPVPRPTTPKKPVPRPMLMSPQEWAKTPAPVARAQAAGSPQGRSPTTPPQQRAWANPRNRSPVTPPSVRGNPATSRVLPPKSLFNASDSVDSQAEGKLTMGPNESGTGYGYQIVLADGGVRYLNNDEIRAIKNRNNGNLPRTIRIPANGSFL